MCAEIGWRAPELLELSEYTRPLALQVGPGGFADLQLAAGTELSHAEGKIRRSAASVLRWRPPEGSLLLSSVRTQLMIQPSAALRTAVHIRNRRWFVMARLRSSDTRHGFFASLVYASLSAI